MGETLGTPEYMSPEQACGEQVDGRSDLYSLGIAGYFALSGTLPFTGSSREVLAQQVTKPAPPVVSVARGTPCQNPYATYTMATCRQGAQSVTVEELAR